MKPTKSLIVAGVAAAALGSLAFAQLNAQNGMGGMDHSGMMAQSNMGGMNHSQMGMGASMGMQDMMQMMGGLDKLTGRNFDRAFLTMMIPHHQAAVDMSREILKTTKNTQVKTWANAIIKAQNTEIAQMNALLKTYGGPDSKMAGNMQGMMSGMVSDIRQAPVAEKDRAFVKGMIPHHASALMMANMALMQAQDPKVLKLSRDIARDQAQEMYDFQLWLRR
ncbi:hypothetical protein Dcae01_03028 [Deinococcus caeni]|uniref:DUF305 domain-containing protein n=2 Tax=Deinococcus caeni TaxID=569127 RepID=A0ABP9UFJ9_9DEIO